MSFVSVAMVKIKIKQNVSDQIWIVESRKSNRDVAAEVKAVRLSQVKGEKQMTKKNGNYYYTE